MHYNVDGNSSQALGKNQLASKHFWSFEDELLKLVYFVYVYNKLFMTEATYSAEVSL